MLSANVTGHANAHRQVRHRARHGLRERCRYRDLNASLLLYPHGTAPRKHSGFVPRPLPRAAHGTCFRLRAAQLRRDRQKPSSAPAPRTERRDAACSFRCPLPPRTAAPTAQAPRHPDLAPGFRGVGPMQERDEFLALQQAPRRLSSSSQSGPEARLSSRIRGASSTPPTEAAPSSSRAQTQTHRLFHSISTCSGPCLRRKCEYTGMLSFPSPYGSIRANE